jgi:hypothetical protein
MACVEQRRGSSGEGSKAHMCRSGRREGALAVCGLGQVEEG